MIEFALNKKKLAANGNIIREGLIFRHGTYPDKNFSLSPEELLAASTDFKPVSINLEHIKTVFDGRLGQLSKVKPSADGTELFGEIEIPKWLDDALGDEPIKVSCEWDRKQKVLGGLAITTRPRIKDAVLMSAFSNALIKEGKAEIVAFKEGLAAFEMDMMEMEMDTNRTWAGLEIMQAVHDRLASCGAVCSPMKEEEDDEDDAEFISQKEASAVQKMHDIAVSEGKARCYFVPANYSEVENKKMTLKEKVLAYFAEAFEKAEKDEAAVVAENKTDDSKLQALEAKFSADLEAFKAEQNTKYEELVTANTQLKADLEAKTAEVEKFSEVVENKDAENVTAKAKAKVEELVTAGKVLPAKRDKLVAVFSELLSVEKPATFSVDGADSNAADILFSLFDGSSITLKEEVPSSGQVLNGEQESDDTSHVERAKAWAKKNYKKTDVSQ